jgi:TolA-binding protein
MSHFITKTITFSVLTLSLGVAVVSPVAVSAEEINTLDRAKLGQLRKQNEKKPDKNVTCSDLKVRLQKRIQNMEERQASLTEKADKIRQKVEQQVADWKAQGKDTAAFEAKVQVVKDAANQLKTDATEHLNLLKAANQVNCNDETAFRAALDKAHAQGEKVREDMNTVRKAMKEARLEAEKLK